ncbi:MAG: hypothetical protein EAZ70_00915 [Runella slithyformis]|nr:MAG: hypothetical protein EAY79_08485 [Runella slithyformis]TAF29683.1 MAG: hypothetical protein EAZ70_00915 [Runella slithyformis]TAF48502.1 MAG: hypothetical protein EAZ63_04300 [Runella slithyformis]TAF83300.1 MAG: hypothetical protein EAZ50_01355 [Runella slithyformis]
MLDIQIMGTNAPREHQRVIRKLIAGLDRLYVLGNIPYEPFPETMLDEGKTSPTPDVILYDSVSDKDVVMIEISTTKGVNGDFKKVSDLVEYYGIQEGFVFNYKTNAWRKYKLGEGEITENPSFCDSIGYDLNDFLK